MCVLTIYMTPHSLTSVPKAQAPSHVSGSGIDGRSSMPQVGRSIESGRVRQFSPMDTVRTNHIASISAF